MNHEFYMQRCLQLALRAGGYVAPNPLVGCVIVHEGEIIGEGYHEKYGGAHAEVNVITSAKDQSLLPSSTLYVNLEPCAHFGKTPPCADLIIEKKIPRVIIGCRDSNPLVSGKGIEKLLTAGVEVTENILEKESRELNKRFFTFHEKKRPYVILKWAQTADGFIAPADRARLQISNHYSQTLVHKWRSEEASVLVGTATAFMDNPQLNVRLWSGHQPLRVVIDRDLKIPATFHLLDGSQPTMVFTAEKKESTANTTYITIDFSTSVRQRMLAALYDKGINSVMVEGGANLLEQFIKHDLWDEARIFTAPLRLKNGILAPLIKGVCISTENIEGDELKIYTHS